jgi:wobble nucleotide-excising tRNase
MPEQSAPILVYNQKFIQDNFFVTDNLKGIFSLSKENKAADEKIAKATIRHHELTQSLNEKRTAKHKTDQAFVAQKQQAVDEIWKIKAKYSGGDRVLEYCLDGLKGQKERLFSHLRAIQKPAIAPKKSIEVLRGEVDALKGDAAQRQPSLPLLTFAASDVELEAILGSSILGNSDSEIAGLIEKLGSSDWVKQGLTFLPDEVDERGETCPFCQEKSITSKFIASVKDYFDDTYQDQMSSLEALKVRYTSAFEQLSAVSTFTAHSFSQERAESMKTKYKKFVDIIRDNIAKIEQKIKSPKAPQFLIDSSLLVANFNEEVIAINEAVNAYNERLDNRDAALAGLKDEFLTLMRWQYDQTMSRYEADLQGTNLKLKELGEEINKIEHGLADASNQIALAQKETINIDEAVVAINAGLVDLGIDGFKISKHTEGLYRVVRASCAADAFHTLSEGEKMMISFLYFCELCKGKASAEDTHVQRVVVIDDPISSLSHIFVFNVGQLIRSVFFKGERFCQVFVLTHSLYFFYELTDTNHERRKENQKLFRITKSVSGSNVQEMKYEEIQNDYQTYWSVINDPAQPPVLIANCMRNIVEYFFNFVRKKDLNNVFQLPEMQAAKFQAFNRYINRESHSLGQNIIDMKEFNYDTFKEGLRLVFDKTGYPDHFKAMSKV